MTLSDEQVMAQVVSAAREIVQEAGLSEVTGGFVFEACNDQGAPPYRGRVDMSFAVAGGVETEQQCREIAEAMVRRGWTRGAPSGKRPFGVAVHSEEAMAIIARASGDPAREWPHYDRSSTRRKDRWCRDQRSAQR
jgi:hypothetical protein